MAGWESCWWQQSCPDNDDSWRGLITKGRSWLTTSLQTQVLEAHLSPPMMSAAACWCRVSRCKSGETVLLPTRHQDTGGCLRPIPTSRSEEHTSELQSPTNLV